MERKLQDFKLEFQRAIENSEAARALAAAEKSWVKDEEHKGG
jgi:hypothetical protein